MNIPEYRHIKAAMLISRGNYKDALIILDELI